ncbi:uncharacterized protein LTR77_006672 [Saxophila tyrrhenica]|uniref:Uncharacterized protein n=1 Tax=Saxophila tyrrhenica TaxID=1690608 RepID=A0AAV9P5G0_9PEZI|nr:hypothetical protein LTR77_006672 [Saxophila tyrrhenica]
MPGPSFKQGCSLCNAQATAVLTGLPPTFTHCGRHNNAEIASFYTAVSTVIMNQNIAAATSTQTGSSVPGAASTTAPVSSSNAEPRQPDVPSRSTTEDVLSDQDASPAHQAEEHLPGLMMTSYEVARTMAHLDVARLSVHYANDSMRRICLDIFPADEILPQLPGLSESLAKMREWMIALRKANLGEEASTPAGDGKRRKGKGRAREATEGTAGVTLAQSQQALAQGTEQGDEEAEEEAETVVDEYEVREE